MTSTMTKHVYWLMGIILMACACSSAPQQETEGKVYQVDLQKKVKTRILFLRFQNNLI